MTPRSSGRAVLILTVLAGALPAQESGSSQQSSPARSAATCADSIGATYLQCGLRYEFGKVYQGQEGLVVAKPGFFRGARLTSVVHGDSAMYYARSFERNSTRGTAFDLLGAALFVSGWLVAENDGCSAATPTRCDGDALPITLGISGLASSVIGAIFSKKARGAASKAVWWNNARFDMPR